MRAATVVPGNPAMPRMRGRPLGLLPQRRVHRTRHQRTGWIRQHGVDGRARFRDPTGPVPRRDRSPDRAHIGGGQGMGTGGEGRWPFLFRPPNGPDHRRRTNRPTGRTARCTARPGRTCAGPNDGRQEARPGTPDRRHIPPRPGRPDPQTGRGHRMHRRRRIGIRDTATNRPKRGNGTDGSVRPTAIDSNTGISNQRQSGPGKRRPGRQRERQPEQLPTGSSGTGSRRPTVATTTDHPTSTPGQVAGSTKPTTRRRQGGRRPANVINNVAHAFGLTRAAREPGSIDGQSQHRTRRTQRG